MNREEDSRTDSTAALTNTLDNTSQSTKYKGTDQDDKPDSDYLDDAIETLLIDIDSPPTSPTQGHTEMFLTSRGMIQHQTAVNTAIALADRSFTHAITGNNPTTDNSSQDPFAYITIS